MLPSQNFSNAKNFMFGHEGWFASMPCQISVRNLANIPHGAKITGSHFMGLPIF
jgi:hypothetical protein